MADRQQVVVVGGGVAGVAIARALVPDAVVRLFERGAVAGDTTSRASGVVTLPLEPVSEAVTAFGLEWFRDLDGTGIFEFTERPTVRLLPEDAYATANSSPPEGAELRSASELEERFPGTFGDLEGYPGGLIYEGTGWLDPVEYVHTLKHEAERAGAEFYRDRTVTDILVDGDEVTGVETDRGRVDADRVVVAAGWRTRELVAEHLAVPTRPYRWNAVVLEPAHPTAMGFPMGSVPDRRLYWRPTRHRNVLVGGNEHLVEDPVGTPATVDESFLCSVRSFGPALRGVEGARAVRADCCPTADTATPDGLPIVDLPAEGPDGLAVATGFHGRGVMLSGVVASTLREHLLGDDQPFETESFALERFESRSPEFDLLSHWD